DDGLAGGVGAGAGGADGACPGELGPPGRVVLPQGVVLANHEGLDGARGIRDDAHGQELAVFELFESRARQARAKNRLAGGSVRLDNRLQEAKHRNSSSRLLPRLNRSRKAGGGCTRDLASLGPSTR